MRILFAVLFSFCFNTFAEVTVNKAFWQTSTREIGASCGNSPTLNVVCLRGLDAVLRELFGRKYHLLLRMQLNENWAEVKAADGKAKFEQGQMILAELTPKGSAEMNKIRTSNYATYMSFYRDLELRYAEMASAGLISADDFKEAFRWVFEQTRDDESARSLYIAYVTAQMRELNHDPHAYLQVHVPKASTSANTPLSLTSLNGHRYVSRVRPGSMADATGVSVGMEFAQVGGLKVNDENFSERLAAFTGQGVPATFIDRLGQAKVVDAWKAEPPLPGVHSYAFSFYGSRIGVVEIYNFTTLNTCQNVQEAIQKIGVEPLRALIVDLRGNLGGDIAHAKCIGGLLFGQGVKIAQMRHLESPEQSYDVMTNHSRVTGSYPITFLIDGGSASASELLAGAAQDLKLAWLVGQRSFGKGVAQSRDAAFLRGEELKGIDVVRTHYRFHFPSGVTPQVVGLVPDFLAPSPVPGLDWDATMARTVDMFGRFYEAPALKIRPDKTRARTRLQVQSCVNKVEKRYLNPGSEAVTRWLEDRQLRMATEVSVCTALISVKGR